jgi:hypothetical protein
MLPMQKALVQDYGVSEHWPTCVSFILRLCFHLSMNSGLGPINSEPETHAFSSRASHLTLQPSTSSTEPMHALGPLDPTMLPETELAYASLQTVHVMLNTGQPTLLIALFFLLTINLSDLIFGNVLGTLQMLTPAAGCLALPTSHDAFLTTLAKAALPYTLLLHSMNHYRLHLSHD